MANIPKNKSPTSHHQQPQPISSSSQTLHHSNSNHSTSIQYNDLVNINYGSVLPYTFVIDPFSPPLDSSFFVPCSSSSHHHHRNLQVNSDSCSCCSSESDCADSSVYADCLYGDNEDYDQMDLITDLFDSRGEIEHESGGLSSSYVEISEYDNAAVNNHNHDQDDAFVSSGVEELGLGLRVARIESDSDTEDLGDDDDRNNDRIENSDLNTEHEIAVIEEISVSSDVSSQGDGSIGVLEWEILMAVNNLERGLVSATDGTEGEGFVYTPEFDTLIGQFVDTVRDLRGSPPAAKSFIDNLPLVAINDEDDAVTCVVCKDEVSSEERVMQLPCMHCYHGECIVPWLSIRNTCPVCRFELPTDDVDYERSKNRVDDDGDEVRVGYGFDLLP